MKAAPARSGVATLLVVGSEPGAPWLERLFDHTAYRLEHLPATLDCWGRADLGDVACILVDLGPGGKEDLARLLLPCRVAPDMPVVVVADSADDELALAAARFGAHDFVAKPELADGRRLRNTLRFAVERRAGQVAQRATEARFRLAFADAPAGMAILSPDGIVLEANAALGDLLASRPARLAGQPFVAALAAATIGGAVFDLDDIRTPTDVLVRAADGSARWGRLKASLAAEPGAQHLVVSMVDVTDVVELQRRFEASIAENEKRLRYEVAVAECSNVLLRAESNRDLDPALKALLEAVEGTSIFVEMNVDDPELGPCTSLLHEVSEPGVTLDFDFWGMMPWSKLPESHAALSRGEIYTMNVSDLSEVERDAYVGIDIKAEANAPIFVRGRWVGLVGLGDRHREREWSDSELRLLRTAAQMIGAFWDKQEVMASLEAAVADAERRNRYEHALFEASRALLLTDDDRALPAAMDAFLGVTDAFETFLERNIDDPKLGPCTEFVCGSRLTPNGIVHDVPEYWRVVPWSRMPDSYLRLSQGEPFSFTLDDLSPTERAVYENANWPLGTEIDIPILVDGVWSGLIGFGHPSETREWHETEVRMLQTAADMIGAFWSRRVAHARMRELVRSKDEFLASVSHELRTPLTTVVGLSAELRDRPDDFEPAERDELIGLIATEAAEMANLVADLLIAARAEIDAVAVEPEAISVADEVRGVVKALSHDKHVEVIGAGDEVAWADPLRARQIIRNLYTNAVRYGGEQIRIEIAEGGGRVLIRVIDDGDPIPAGERGRIFEPYHRAHDTPSQPGSVGLGLTVARRLARLMGGDLQYRAADGNVFEMTLPAAP